MRLQRDQGFYCCPLVLGAVVMMAVSSMWSPHPAAAQEVDVAGWQKDLGKAEEMLEKGGERRSAKAERICQETLEAMLGVVGTRPVASELYGRVMQCLAISESRSGDDSGAFWHMAVAYEIYPQVSKSKLAKVEDVMALNARVQIDDEERAAMLMVKVPGEGSTAPSPISMIPISYPRAIRKEGHIGQAEVILLIDESGFPIRPLLRNSGGVPGFDLAVMEAARYWTFTPATAGGLPVAGRYVVNARFQLGK